MLDDDTKEQLRAAVCQKIAETHGPHDALNTAIEAVARRARRVGMSAEHLVIAVKALWFELSEEGIISHDGEHSRLRDAIVSSTIKAYYVHE